VSAAFRRLGLVFHVLELTLETVGADTQHFCMDTAPDLTPSEVVDRARAARQAQQVAAFEQLELTLLWARLHPCPANELPAYRGDPNLHLTPEDLA
jgi:hypothetical protein